jgi:small subunit ribosomal protein S8
MTDPIADLLTRIRNGLQARHEAVEVPMSKQKERIVAILKEEGYVGDYSVIETQPRATLRVELRYYDDKRPVIIGLKRVSSPGRRAYYGSQDIPKVRGGLGTGVISTSRGLMTDRAARRANIGGEFICAVW